MPHSRAVSAKEADAIRRFVHGGGLLIADILPGILNGHGTRRSRACWPTCSRPASRAWSTASARARRCCSGTSSRATATRRSATCRAGASSKAARGAGGSSGEEAGDQPEVTVTHRGQGRVPPTEIFRFTSGEAEYVGLLREYFMYDLSAYPVTVRLRKAPCVRHARGQVPGPHRPAGHGLSYEATCTPCCRTR